MQRCNYSISGTRNVFDTDPDSVGPGAEERYGESHNSQFNSTSGCVGAAEPDPEVFWSSVIFFHRFFM